MFRFFRQIRQRLLPIDNGSENRFSKYLLYAIGEIVLVVIGILIALQINSWNNDLQDREKEKYYLNSVKTSIELSQKELDRVIQDAELISSAADTLLFHLAYEKYDLLQGIFLDSLLLTAGDYSQISLNDGGIKEVLNTGSLDIIENDNIRIMLASWNERIHVIRKYETETVKLAGGYEEVLNTYLDRSRWILDSSVVSPDKRNALLSNTSLRNYLDLIAGAHYGMHQRYSNEKIFLDSLRGLINEHLGR